RREDQTTSALGLSNKIGAQGDATTTGQGGATAGQQAPAQQNQGQCGANQQQAPAQQNQGANQPSTSGQGSANQQQAPAQQNQGANQPPTSGQGSANQQQAPAEQNQGANQPSTSGSKQPSLIPVPFQPLAPPHPA